MTLLEQREQVTRQAQGQARCIKQLLLQAMHNCNVDAKFMAEQLGCSVEAYSRLAAFKPETTLEDIARIELALGADLINAKRLL